MKPIINIYDAELGYQLQHGDQFEVRAAPLAEKVGARMIGANLTTVPPGKAAFPFHHHYANEEHFLILRGSGKLRSGSETYAVRVGDYIVSPAGGAEHAHQLVNTGGEDLVYLSLSTLLTPEVVGYPDSAKIGVRPQPYGAPASKRYLIAESDLDKAQYWDGEDGRQVRALVEMEQGKS
jgi:uncharacterized cupin superfamily protein